MVQFLHFTSLFGVCRWERSGKMLLSPACPSPAPQREFRLKKESVPQKTARRCPVLFQFIHIYTSDTARWSMPWSRNLVAAGLSPGRSHLT